MPISRLLLALGVIVLMWKLWPHPQPTADRLANGYAIQPLEHYRNTFRILGIEHYYADKGAGISPVDFAVGMGPMTDKSVYEKVSISQGNRWYHWHVDEFPIPRRELEINSANMHIIPATPAVADQINQIREHQLVILEGELVEVSGPNGFNWRSSLSREDTGDGACELMRVDSVQWLER